MPQLRRLLKYNQVTLGLVLNATQQVMATGSIELALSVLENFGIIGRIIFPKAPMSLLTDGLDSLNVPLHDGTIKERDATILAIIDSSNLIYRHMHYIESMVPMFLSARTQANFATEMNDKRNELANLLLLIDNEEREGKRLHDKAVKKSKEKTKKREKNEATI